ncbi:MAG: AMP-binding protein [Neomegalonema sp.]|nr:AMP-binding protein [Neomegalonema sp.]
MDHFDALEARDPKTREEDLFVDLRLQIARAKANSSYYRRVLADVDSNAIIDRAAFAKLPVLSKSDLIDLQSQEPPLGGLETEEVGAMRRLFLSPGPIAEAQGAGEKDHWRMARAMYAAGFRKGDRITNCFSYHLTPAGFMFDGAAAAVGCAVFPGGVGNTETQVQAINRLGITGYVGTPDFLQIIMQKADEMGTPITTMRRALVTGGPLFPQTRAWYEERGVRVRQCYGTAELGLLAYETEDPADGMIVDEGCVLEIVRPGGGEAVEEGEIGEIVATTFDAAYPLIRLGTGDLSAFAEGPSKCGRTNRRIKGWMGRADQTTKVRGMFVHPRQVEAVLKRAPEIAKVRLEVIEEGGKDVMRLLCEGQETPELTKRLEDALRIETRLRGQVWFANPGELPDDGKLIVDMRGL